MTDHRKDMRQDIPAERQDGLNNQSDARNRANQAAASRPGVDAEHALDEAGNMTATPHEGSAFEPLRMGSDEDRQREEDSNYVIDQGAAQRSGDQHGVSRQGAVTQHGDAIRETQSAPGGGSVFQPLAADQRHVEDPAENQRGNPAGQNQQGLNETTPGAANRDERLRDGTHDSEPRGYPPSEDQRRP